MATTDRNLVYGGLLSRTRTVMSSPIGAMAGWDGDRIYISDDDSLPTWATAELIQIIPGDGASKHPLSGVGLIEETFRVRLWTRMLNDPGGRASEHFNSATKGWDMIMSVLRATTGINQQLLTGRLTIPTRLISIGSPQLMAEHEGWMSGEDTYAMGYEIAWAT